ncbi:M23 family metallopeptidase [Paraburkholderia sp. C35]|uniref:M23 family metallopeptidase n=1 Tax=Paraburkholderia sp. C35 TaxID=2126993 RepID=UPI000D699E7B|nr:M23 family metallopeptidase [Paraburkholderia sp. C35]
MNQLRSFLARGQGIPAAALCSLPVNRKTLSSVAAFSALWIGASVMPGTSSAMAAQKAHKHGSAQKRRHHHAVAQEMTTPRAQTATSLHAGRPSLHDADRALIDPIDNPADDVLPEPASVRTADDPAMQLKPSYSTTSINVRMPSNELVLGTVCATTPTMCVPVAHDRSADAHEWSGRVTREGVPDESAQATTPFGDVTAFGTSGDALRSSPGAIDTTLRESLTQAGFPASVVAQIGGIFAGHVDVDAPAQAGDEYRIVMDSAHQTGASRIASLEIRLNGRVYDALWFTAPGASQGAYYSFDGAPIASEPFAMPLDYRRVSSPFGMRIHPVYGERRFHTGVDLTAPAGTPIYAAAAGTVELAVNGHGYGKHVVLRHDDGYSTYYAHMATFAADLKVGERVEQGQVIGYVGRTGTATGPHLHYEVRKDDHPVDPLTLTAHQFVAPLSGTARLAFYERVDAARTSLASLASPVTRVALILQPPRFF